VCLGTARPLAPLPAELCPSRDHTQCHADRAAPFRGSSSHRLQHAWILPECIHPRERYEIPADEEHRFRNRRSTAISGITRSLWSFQVASARSVRRGQERPGTTDIARAASPTLTTVLTTTGPDKLPRSAILQSADVQVSHGMRQPARSLQARGIHEPRGQLRPVDQWAILSLHHVRWGCGPAIADTRGDREGLRTSLPRSRQAATSCPLGTSCGQPTRRTAVRLRAPGS
jgi:hypothetical protein